MANATPDAVAAYALTFAAYEALRLLVFTRSSSLPMGKLGVRLMVHPAAVTTAIACLEQRGLVRRQMSPDDRRVVLATITPAGRTLADEATDALNHGGVRVARSVSGAGRGVTAILNLIRGAAGDA